MEQERLLRRGSDSVEHARAQGRLEVIDRLLGLQDEIRQYNKDVLAGKAKPKGETNAVGIKI